jgi:tRNA G18 (ribose-2'-O)-methylase SpoU
MERVLIDDLRDPRLAPYRDLKVSNTSRHLGQFVVEGEKLFQRLCASRFPVASVLVGDRHEARVADRVPPGVPLYVLPESLISRLVGFNFHQGVLACGHRQAWPNLEEVAATAGPRSMIVICPKIDNPENLGAMIRIADVFGLDAVIVGGRAPDPLSRRVLRVSMGTVLRLPAIVSEHLQMDVEQLQLEQGFSLAATVLDSSAVPLDEFVRPDRLGIVFGCEGNGLEPEWIDRCDQRLTIPMRSGAESLNVAVSAGIVLYHLSR